jgi:hypothetical protein
MNVAKDAATMIKNEMPSYPSMRKSIVMQFSRIFWKGYIQQVY